MFGEEYGGPLKEGDNNEPQTSDEQILQAEPGSFVVQEEPIEENEMKKPDDAEFDWNLKGFPKPRKTEDIDFDWRIADTDAQEDNASISADLKETSGVAEEPLDLTKELNKYFTFDKASEDFQKLLDKEYEKIAENLHPMDNHYIGNMNLADRVDSEAVETEFQPNAESIPEASEETSEEASEEALEQAIPEVIAEEDPLKKDFIEEEEPEVIWVGNLPDPQPEPATETVSDPEPEPKPEPEPAPESQTEPGPHSDPEPDQSTEDLVPLWFDVKEEGVETERKRGGYIGKVILALIIIALLAEAILLGIQYFMPGSAAAQQAKAINSTVSETLVDWKDRAIGAIKGFGADEEVDSEGVTDPDAEEPDAEDPDQGNNEVPANEPDPIPVADKEALIVAVSDRNENIAAVKANDSLVWKSDTKYAEADITNSKPIENNHWTTLPNGEHVYYDREIVATLIDFDSKWIDYVNGGSDDVIELTKEGSQARKNAVGFSKVGKVQQTFRLLEVGEIRQGEKAFYAWTYEEIEEVQGGKTAIKKYNWIYQLEPVDGEMKIVRYYNY